MLLARELTERVIGLAIEVHRLSRPGHAGNRLWKEYVL